MPRVTAMPPSVYNRVVYTIRDYPRMVRELAQLRKDAESVGAVNMDGMPKAPGAGGGLENKVAKIADLAREVEAIEDALDTLPDDMRNGILNNVLYNNRFPCNRYGQLVPSLRTWQREKQKFLVLVAHKLRIY